MATSTNIYCDFAAGSDSSGDGTISNPYKTFQKGVTAATGSVPGDGADKTIWLRGTTPYLEEVRLTEPVVADIGSPLLVEGYTNNPGDGGVAVIDGENTRANGLALTVSGDNNNYHWVFNNIHWRRYTDNCIDGVFGGSAHLRELTFRHCKFSDSVLGVQGNSGHNFYDCWWDNNITAMDGVWWFSGNLLRCIVENNTNGIEMSKPLGGVIWNCLFRNNTNYSVSTNNGVPIVNCVIDGNGKVGQIGVKYPDPTKCIPKILNTIILDCVVGVEGYGAGAEEFSAIFNCCFHNNTNDFTNGAAKRTGCIFADPQFVDKANKDYGIKSASPCKEAGLDLKALDYLTLTASRIDIGMLQENRSGISSGNIGAPLGFSVER